MRSSLGIEILPLVLAMVGGLTGIPLPLYLRRTTADVNMKLEKTTAFGLLLALAGLFIYSEVVRKDHEMHMKEHKYQEMVKSVKGII